MYTKRRSKVFMRTRRPRGRFQRDQGHVESRCGKLKELQGVQDSSVYKGRKVDVSAKETEGYW